MELRRYFRVLRRVLASRDTRPSQNPCLVAASRGVHSQLFPCDGCNQLEWSNIFTGVLVQLQHPREARFVLVRGLLLLVTHASSERWWGKILVDNFDAGGPVLERVFPQLIGTSH